MLFQGKSACQKCYKRALKFVVPNLSLILVTIATQNDPTTHLNRTHLQMKITDHNKLIKINQSFNMIDHLMQNMGQKNL